MQFIDTKVTQTLSAKLVFYHNEFTLIYFFGAQQASFDIEANALRLVEALREGVKPKKLNLEYLSRQYNKIQMMLFLALNRLDPLSIERNGEKLFMSCSLLVLF